MIKLEALEAGLQDLRAVIIRDRRKRFASLSLEQKILALHHEVLELANEMGVQLPVHG